MWTNMIYFFLFVIIDREDMNVKSKIFYLSGKEQQNGWNMIIIIILKSHELDFILLVEPGI